MATQEAVKIFLTDIVGYGRLDKLQKGQKPVDTRVKEFLEGTLFGTIGANGVVCDRGDLPHFPMIQKADGDPDNGGLEWAIHGETQTHAGWISQFVRGFAQELFPGYRLSESNIKNYEELASPFSIELYGKGLNVLIRGRHNSEMKKEFNAGFNLDFGVVKGINAIVEKYEKIRALPLHEALKAFSRKKVNTSTEAVVDTDLLGLVKKYDEMLLSTLRKINPPVYDNCRTYQKGSLMAHMSFGFGIVEKTGQGLATAYFPRISESKTLACAK